MHIEDTWYRQTALDDLLNGPEGKIDTDRLHTGLDMLFRISKDELEIRPIWHHTQQWGSLQGRYERQD